jgi:23S rRNA (cytosine1962-C5)-methyltransferase
MARENARLNEVGDRTRFEQSDVTDKLAELNDANETFDVVIVDPPKFARHRKGVETALKGYEKLNAAAIRSVSPGGILCSCSCSGLVTRQQFQAVIARAALETNRRVQILEQRGQASDHPVSVFCPESDYLKCLICRIL